MPDQLMQYPPRPDASHLITEDDRPVDNRFSERQMRMLPHILLTSWHEGKPFEALADVGLFSNLENEDVVVPDFLLSLGITPRPLTGDVENRSYLMWVYGKAPDLVIEIVSNDVGGELTTKRDKYARIRVTYYAVYDPFKCLGKRVLRLFHLVDGRYVEMTRSSLMTEIGLRLVIWKGRFEDAEARWLRFMDRHGNLLQTGEELAASAQAGAREAEQRAGQAEQRAGQAEQRAGQAEQRAGQAEQRAKLEIARKALSKGMAPEDVAELTGLALEQLETLSEKNEDS